MHAYRWSIAGLLQKLKEFEGGQFRLESPNGPTFQGEIGQCTKGDGPKIILISFRWLAERRFTIGDGWRLQEYWGKLDIPNHVMPIDFTYYYFQRPHRREKGKPDREERVKLWTKMSEVGRFYKKGDPLLLVERDGRFEPTKPPFDGKD